jgi:hypothetical protein
VNNDPPMDYRLRVTSWARGISLRVTVAGALEVIAPRRYGARTITRILTREAAWIRAARADAAARRQALPPPPAWRLPPEISLPAVGTHWTVTMRTAAARAYVWSTPGRTRVAGPVPIPSRAPPGAWLRRQGQIHLLPAGGGEPRVGSPTRSTVRLARSRWGAVLALALSPERRPSSRRPSGTRPAARALPLQNPTTPRVLGVGPSTVPRSGSSPELRVAAGTSPGPEPGERR